MIILMKNDKGLAITKASTIYQSEIAADTITFYAPSTYGEIDLTSDVTTTLHYLDGIANAHEVALTAEEETDKEGYVKYVFTVPTDIPGTVTLHLSFDKSVTNVDEETGEETTTVTNVLKSGKVEFEILQWTKNFNRGE